MSAASLVATLGWNGRICPVCERLVKSGVKWGSNKPGFKSLNGAGMCSRCAGMLTVRASRKCGGWIVPGMAQVIKPNRTCLLHHVHRVCYQCGETPWESMLTVAKALDVSKVACPKCLAAKKIAVPLECVSDDGTFEAVSCGSCHDQYILSGTGHAIIQMSLASRRALHIQQTGWLAQYREFIDSRGPLPVWVQSGFSSHLLACQGENSEEVLGLESLRDHLLSRGLGRSPSLVLRLPD